MSKQDTRNAPSKVTRRIFLRGAAIGTAGLVLGGCAQDHGQHAAKTPKRTDTPACPVCGKTGEEGDYCKKCNAIVTTLGKYECAKCGKTVQSGTYCKKHNRFRFNEADGVTCAQCGKNKGTWCSGCGKYARLPKVSYCTKCKMPFDVTENDGKCTRCGG